MCPLYHFTMRRYNMISGKYPFDGETIYALFDNIAKGEYVLPAEASDPILKSLLAGRCLVCVWFPTHIFIGILDKDPEKRSSLDEIAQHM